MSAARSAVKHAVERALVAGGAAALARARRKDEILILAYHNVVPRGEPVCGDRSLHLPQATFARQLDVLVRTHDVVPLADVLDARPAGERPRAVISFDDACRGAVSVGVEECAARGLPATIFVPAGLLGHGSLWWDALADTATGQLDPSMRQTALDGLAGRDEEIRRWANDSGAEIREVHPHQQVASEAELVAATDHAGITLGSHSWSHANLTRLDGPSLDAELRLPMERLRERFPAYIPWLAYPYGKSNAAVEQAAADVGYAGAVLVSGGWFAPEHHTRPHAVPRVNIPAGISHAGFVLRASGWRSGS